VKVKPGTYQVEKVIDDKWSQRVAPDDVQNPMFYYVLGNLYPSTYYELQVEAMNAIGWSPPSDEFVFKTEDFPFGWLQFNNLFMCICGKLHRMVSEHHPVDYYQICIGRALVDVIV